MRRHGLLAGRRQQRTMLAACVVPVDPKAPLKSQTILRALPIGCRGRSRLWRANRMLRAHTLMANLLLLVAILCCSVAFGFGQLGSSLPTAKEVVERYDQALGGRDAIMRH